MFFLLCLQKNSESNKIKNSNLMKNWKQTRNFQRRHFYYIFKKLNKNINIDNNIPVSRQQQQQQQNHKHYSFFYSFGQRCTIFFTFISFLLLLLKTKQNQRKQICCQRNIVKQSHRKEKSWLDSILFFLYFACTRSIIPIHT